MEDPLWGRRETPLNVLNTTRTPLKKKIGEPLTINWSVQGQFVKELNSNYTLL
jgi:hypothetical protein